MYKYCLPLPSKQCKIQFNLQLVHFNYITGISRHTGYHRDTGPFNRGTDFRNVWVFSTQCGANSEKTQEMCCITMATGRVDAETPLAARLQLSLSIACTKGGPSPKRSLSLKGNKRRWEDSFLSDLDSVQPPSKCLQRLTDSKELLTWHFQECSCAQKRVALVMF